MRTHFARSTPLNISDTLIIISIFLFPLLMTVLLFLLLMWFLLYDSDSMSLKRYHFLPLFLITLDTLRTMLISVGGRELRK